MPESALPWRRQEAQWKHKLLIECAEARIAGRASVVGRPRKSVPALLDVLLGREPCDEEDAPTPLSNHSCCATYLEARSDSCSAERDANASRSTPTTRTCGNLTREPVNGHLNGGADPEMRPVMEG